MDVRQRLAFYRNAIATGRISREDVRRFEELPSAGDHSEHTRGNGGLEYRAFPVRELEARDAEGDNPPHFSGYAAVFDEETEIWDFFGPYREKIAPGAFASSIASSDPLDDTALLIGHDDNPTMVLARKSSGTLDLREDNHGLLVNADLDPEQTTANDLIRVMKRKDVTQMSFGFIVTAESWEIQEDGTEIRTILACQLFDVSPVTFPAYPTTSAGIRSRQIEARRVILRKKVNAITDNLRAALEGAVVELRVGKVISAENQAAIEEAIETIEDAVETAEDAIEALEAVLDNAGITDPADDEPEEGDEGGEGDSSASSKSTNSRNSAAAADTTDDPAAPTASVDLLRNQLALLELEGGRSTDDLR